MASVPQYRSGLSEALAVPDGACSPVGPGPAATAPARHARSENPNPSTVKKGFLNPSGKRRVGKSMNRLSPAALEAYGVITPALLAKYHLPDILLTHGPLSVRHIMAYLTTNVPGFSGVPLPKQRRLVTSALEGSHNGVPFGAGLEGDLVFEKASAGRWQARHRNGGGGGGTTLPPVRIPKSDGSTRRSNLRFEADSPTMEASDKGNHGHGWKRESGVFLQDEDVDGGGEGREKIALDDEDVPMVGLDFASSSDCITQETLTDPSARDGDSTDEEDWASIGAEGVRNPASIPSGGQAGAYFTRRSGLLFNNVGLARSLPREARISVASHRKSPANSKRPGGVERPREEQEAVEALVKLGSF